MKTKNALTVGALMSGKYDIPGQKLEVRGRDMYGEEVIEYISAIDRDRLNADIEAIMASDEPPPLPRGA